MVASIMRRLLLEGIPTFVLIFEHPDAVIQQLHGSTQFVQYIILMQDRRVQLLNIVLQVHQHRFNLVQAGRDFFQGRS